MIVGVKRTAVIDDLPDLNASLSAFSFLLEELLVIGACGSELVGKGMKVYREDAVFESVPANVRRIDAHNLAVDYIIVQSLCPGSLCRACLDRSDLLF